MYELQAKQVITKFHAKSLTISLFLFCLFEAQFLVSVHPSIDRASSAEERGERKKASPVLTRTRYTVNGGKSGDYSQTSLVLL